LHAPQNSRSTPVLTIEDVPNIELYDDNSVVKIVPLADDALNIAAGDCDGQSDHPEPPTSTQTNPFSDNEKHAKCKTNKAHPSPLITPALHKWTSKPEISQGDTAEPMRSCSQRDMELAALARSNSQRGVAHRNVKIEHESPMLRSAVHKAGSGSTVLIRGQESVLTKRTGPRRPTPVLFPIP
jgi:hypothetical protein